MRTPAVLALLAAAIAACRHPAPGDAPAPPASTAPPISASATPPTSASAARKALAVHGRLLGRDGKPMRAAHVLLGGQRVAVEADGTFHAGARGPGFQVARFSGVDHAELAVGLLLEGEAVELDVALGTYPREPILLPRARVFAFRGGERELARTVTLNKQPDGTYAADVEPEGSDLFYDLGEVAERRNVNGTQGDGYLHDGGGDYLSVVRNAGSRVRLRFDPAALPAPGQAATVRFARPASRVARLAALHLDAARRAEEALHGPVDPAWRRDLVAAAEAEPDAGIRAAMGLAYLAPGVPPEPAGEEAIRVARGLLAALPPEAELWAFAPGAALAAVELAGDRPEDQALLERILAALRDKEPMADVVRARARAAVRAARDDEAERLHALLRRSLAGTGAARDLRDIDPSRRVRPGQPLPAFDLPALDDGHARYTAEGLRGRVVLLDFWATWCGACVAEMEGLHRVHARHKARGFTILSIAVDSPAKVRAFRRGRFPMPWQHVVLGRLDLDDVQKRFEVASYPTPILVGADGRILATGEDARGAALAQAVEAAMAAQAR